MLLELVNFTRLKPLAILEETLLNNKLLAVLCEMSFTLAEFISLFAQLTLDLQIQDLI